jgi:hypothetical protein
MTAISGLADPNHMIAAGFQGQLKKPFRPEQLVEEIKLVLTGLSLSSYPARLIWLEIFFNRFRPHHLVESLSCFSPVRPCFAMR